MVCCCAIATIFWSNSGVKVAFPEASCCTIAATCCNNSGETAADSAVACGSTGFDSSGVGSACCGSAAGFADAGICGIALASRTGGIFGAGFSGSAELVGGTAAVFCGADFFGVCGSSTEISSKNRL